jgi:plasmid stabilization system protein ParE
MQLSLHPKSGPIFRETVRRLFLGKFPYWVYYTEDGETIMVIAILHAKRDSETDLSGHGD